MAAMKARTSLMTAQLDKLSLLLSKAHAIPLSVKNILSGLLRLTDATLIHN